MEYKVLSRLTVFVMLLSICLSASAQLSEASVCGIKMGTGREEARSILENRFGRLSVRGDNGALKVYDASVGGVKYDSLTFLFAWVNGDSKLNGACLRQVYELNEEYEALKAQGVIKSVYERKYVTAEYDREGFKGYVFGIGLDPYGTITVNKYKSNDGRMRLYVDVNYFGPYSDTDDI